MVANKKLNKLNPVPTKCTAVCLKQRDHNPNRDFFTVSTKNWQSGYSCCLVERSLQYTSTEIGTELVGRWTFHPRLVDALKSMILG